MPEPDDPSDAGGSTGLAGPSGFGPGQIVTVFRSHVRPQGAREYAATAPEILELALGMPGLVDVKSFAADDGEHVTIATFVDEQSQRAWREHAEHRRAQRAGRDRFYAAYAIQVCETISARTFRADDGVQH